MDTSRDFEMLAMPHATTLFRVAMAMCGNQANAEDLVQTAMVKALVNFNSFIKGSSCKSWLIRIMRNTWIDELRHRRVTGPQVTIDEHLLPEKKHREETHWSNPTDLLENFSDKQIIEALMALPDDQRLTLYLTDVEQLNQDEVAEILSIAVGTVKSRTSRARATLRDKLSEYAADMGFSGRGQR